MDNVVNNIITYLPWEYVSLAFSGEILARTWSTTSVKLPEQLAYLAKTVLPRETVANNIGILAAYRCLMQQWITWFCKKGNLLYVNGYRPLGDKTFSILISPYMKYFILP